jgi:hypothetical protein
VLSYRDHIDFGIVADRELVDDTWPMIRSAAEALDELDEVVCGGRGEDSGVEGDDSVGLRSQGT